MAVVIIAIGVLLTWAAVRSRRGAGQGAGYWERKFGKPPASIPAPRQPLRPPTPESKYARAAAARLAKPAKTPPRKPAARNHGTVAPPSFAITAEQIDRMIAGLPKRTLEQLRQQWLNLVRLDPEQAAVTTRFKEALLKEWDHRARLARGPDDYFKWPSTRGGLGDGTMQFDAWNEQGMLRYLGYRVGSTQGESDATRHRILDAAFAAPMPPVNNPEYTRSWAAPNSPARLKRLANEIARFARNAKSKRSADMSSAIDDWEDDLNYLYDTYYVRQFGFAWPQVNS